MILCEKGDEIFIKANADAESAVQILSFTNQGAADSNSSQYCEAKGEKKINEK